VTLENIGEKNGGTSLGIDGYEYSDLHNNAPNMATGKTGAEHINWGKNHFLRYGRHSTILR